MPKAKSFASSLQARVHAWLQKLSLRLWGPDIFISYRQEDDKRHYARALEVALRPDYACFLDTRTELAGDDSDDFLRKARRSRMFVLIGTSGIFKSTYIPDEIQAYWLAHNAWPWRYFRRIAPINVDGALVSFMDIKSREFYKGEKWEPVAGRVVVAENASAFAAGNPSQSVVDQIRASYGVIRSDMISIFASLTLSALILLGTFGIVRSLNGTIRAQGEEIKSNIGQITSLSKVKTGLENEVSSLKSAVRDEEIQKVQADVERLASQAGLERVTRSLPSFPKQQAYALEAVRTGLLANPPYLIGNAINELVEAYNFVNPVREAKFNELSAVSDITDDLDYVIAIHAYSLHRWFLQDFTWNYGQGNLLFAPGGCYDKARGEIKTQGKSKGLGEIVDIRRRNTASLRGSAFLILSDSGFAGTFHFPVECSFDWEKEGVLAADLSPDAAFVASVHPKELNVSRNFAGARQQPIATYSWDFSCQKETSRVRFSEDGKRLGVHCGTTLLVLEWDRSNLGLRVLDRLTGVGAFALHPREDIWAARIQNNVELHSKNFAPPTVDTIFLPETLKARRQVLGDYFHELSFSPDGSVLAALKSRYSSDSKFSSGDEDDEGGKTYSTAPSTITFFSTQDPKRAFSTKTADGAVKLKFGENGHHLAAVSPFGIALHYIPASSDWQTLEEISSSNDPTPSMIARWLDMANRSRW